MISEINKNELSQLLELYLHLHEQSIPEMTEHLENTWNTIMQDITVPIKRLLFNDSNCTVFLLFI